LTAAAAACSPAGVLSRGRLGVLYLALAGVLVVGLLALAAAAVGGGKPSGSPLPVFTPVSSSVLSAPQAVTGTDGRRHLVYEVQLVNTSPLEVRLNGVAVRDGATDAEIKAFSGAAIPPVLSTPLAPATDTLPAAQNGVLWLDVSFPAGAKLPASLAHRFVITLSGPGFPAREITWVGAPTKVSKRPPVVISPPLKGAGYFDENGCCGESNHTRALLTIDGDRFLAQRYAVDWIRFDAKGRWVVGDPSVNESYIVFGNPIHAVAPGRVVSIRADLPENTPPTPLADLNPRNALGNHIAQDLGGGRFALYAHMQPNSIPSGIRLGSRLKRGQVIGRVGNTGSSTAPHLHFHVTDGPDALVSDGRPYVFSRFEYTDVVTNAAEVSDEFATAVLRPAEPPLVRHRELPLTGDVVTFP